MLDRFRDAQAAEGSGYQTALAEIRAGRKRGHWIWYVLPQIAGLGSSPPSRRYAIADRDEAAQYLGDPELRGRLLEMARAIAAQLDAGMSLRGLMGSEIDALKTVSSLTLFGRVAEELGGELEPLARVAREVLERAQAQGYPRCPYTIRALAERGDGAPADSPRHNP